MRLALSKNCCKAARDLIANGLDPKEILEFHRGDVLCLRGQAWAFAKLSARETREQGPRFVKYDPPVEGRFLPQGSPNGGV